VIRIHSIDVRWHHGYGNMPEMVVTVSKLPPRDAWIYNPIPVEDGRARFLLSTNQWPWSRFVLIRDPNGSPNLHGALGGEYRLIDGSTLMSRTGWSSREGVVNSLFRNYVPDDLLAPVTVEVAKGYKWHGYYIGVGYLRNHALFPEGIYLVRDEKADGEVTYYPSVHPERVEKATPKL